ncbi:MAG: GGDEF domain-containing protein [Spirochaetales bacterium]|nr:GGDEF domain-containing protein [Spirochaetales bacterium]
MASVAVKEGSIENLIHLSQNIVDVREFLFQPSLNGPLGKWIGVVPSFPEEKLPTGVLESGFMERVFGKKAPRVRQVLQSHGFLSAQHDVLTWRFRRSLPEEFELGLGSIDHQVFRRLDAQLWKPFTFEQGGEEFLSFLDGKWAEDSTDFARTPTERWFRQGAHLVAVRFHSPPSGELLELLNVKLRMIREEELLEEFRIITSSGTDTASWRRESNRQKYFFDVAEGLLKSARYVLDLKSCELSVYSEGDESLYIAGTLSVTFPRDMAPHSAFESSPRRFGFVKNDKVEFCINDAALRTAATLDDSYFLSLRLESWSPGAANPQFNPLADRFFRMLLDALSKLVDGVLPIMRREKTLNDLRWRSFLDIVRLQGRERGENLHLILSDILVLLKRFFHLEQFYLFTEDRDVAAMLQYFAQEASQSSLYTILEKPLTPGRMLREQFVMMPVRKSSGSQTNLYFTLPGASPSSSTDVKAYQEGTALRNILNKSHIGGKPIGEVLFFLITECLSVNPREAMKNLRRRLDVKNGGKDLLELEAFGSTLLQRSSRVFDLFGILSDNLESGLAYMRGRRDNLTGLYNRLYFKTCLLQNFLIPGRSIGLMFLDMDHFKIFNDSVSHDFGDKLLMALSERMREALRPLGGEGLAGRFGGDEFCLSVMNRDIATFEHLATQVFQAITCPALEVEFCVGEHQDTHDLSINLIGFLHRLIRPDIGSRQASRTEFRDKPGQKPQERVMDIWRHYHLMNGKSLPQNGKGIPAERVVTDLVTSIEDKILYNQMLKTVDDEFRELIRMFVILQLKNWRTGDIRKRMGQQFQTSGFQREISLKVSAGLAHSGEDRLRSVDSLFKAADDRSYLAKQNGRNRLVGVDGLRLA